jgi:hypothetical protein
MGMSREGNGAVQNSIQGLGFSMFYGRSIQGAGCCTWNFFYSFNGLDLRCKMWESQLVRWRQHSVWVERGNWFLTAHIICTVMGTRLLLLPQHLRCSTDSKMMLLPVAVLKLWMWNFKTLILAGTVHLYLSSRARDQSTRTATGRASLCEACSCSEKCHL